MIATEFQIAGLTINVRENKKMFEERGIGGEALYLEQVIEIDPTAQHIESVEQTFCHEKVHWILFVMNSELRSNEKFVDSFAHLLYQIEKTSKGDFIKESGEKNGIQEVSRGKDEKQVRVRGKNKKRPGKKEH